MIKRLLKLCLWPTLMTIVGVIVMISLGTWQLHRLTWKNNLQKRIYERQQQSTITDELFLQSTPQQFADAEYQRLQITGSWLHDYEMKLIGRVFNGRSGYHLITPLQTLSGKIVIVDRGWVPFSQINAIDRPLSLQIITGYIQNRVYKNLFTPENNWVKRELYTLDIQDITHNNHFGSIVPFTLKQMVNAKLTLQLSRYPIPIELNATLYNKHLQYAFTWYAFAVILLVIYIIYVRRNYLPIPA